jgi:hypothetical protein
MLTASSIVLPSALVEIITEESGLEILLNVAIPLAEDFITPIPVPTLIK